MGRLIGTIVLSNISGLFFAGYLYADDIFQTDVTTKRTGAFILAVVFVFIAILVAVL